MIYNLLNFGTQEEILENAKTEEEAERILDAARHKWQILIERKPHKQYNHYSKDNRNRCILNGGRYVKRSCQNRLFIVE